MTEQNQTVKELEKISKILLLAHGEQLELELGRIATTNDRKKIWALIDGTSGPEEISKQTKLSVGSIRNFLTTLEKAELIENPYGKPPRRLIGYVPPSWIDLVIKEQQVSKEKEGEETSVVPKTEKVDSTTILKEGVGQNEQ